jgi:hypothetical protein
VTLWPLPKSWAIRTSNTILLSAQTFKNP